MREFQATFVGIGGQKCATTWLYGVLRQCPDAAVSDEKEVDFFSYYFDRGYEWYERHFAGTAGRRHRGEISPSYLIHPAAPARAAAYNPDLHVFVTLRDPVRRAFSNHLHEARKGHVSGANLVFETALDNNPLYLDQGRYATHLARWYDHFPADRIHVLFQEEITADRAGAARAVTDVLGLAPLQDFLDLRANESVRYRNPALGTALWRLGRAARDRGLGRLVEHAKAAPGIRQLRSANREAMTEVVDPMAPETERRLEAFYADEVAALERLVGRPAPWPRFAPAGAPQAVG
ncbi:sulfotransferase domain-containing protein [Roseivivax isoporae]|uniref:Sulfotransferase domain-containing protein n=1 Tax=Roseivivax isoporae LMG 25204 TaxID=1449351 RepID=X7F552_9RHOB|nr:sulfotransferase domain-containing protein [Roseivivax isoporae]ETX27226.1 hypothetical protein RISW2_15000 [Roseivivax isoporae LMG 25204]